VWNIIPYFKVDEDFFIISFEYLFDPDAAPSLVIAESYALTASGPLDPAEKLIHRATSPDDNATYATVAPTTGRGPLMALMSLLLMALAVQVGVRGRSVC
jgi:hypothetical protein